MRPPRPRPAPPVSGKSSTPAAKPAPAPGKNRYAPKLQRAVPKSKQKITGNFLFRTIFFLAFILTVHVLGPNYKIRGAAISFGLIGLMLLGVILIDVVMWKCPNCGRYLGILPWPGKRCRKCRVRLF